MAEYITKESVADALFSDEHMDDVVFSANHICRIVANLPAVDVRPVVRCKDCGYYHEAHRVCGNAHGIRGAVFPSDHCSHASPDCGADMRDREAPPAAGKAR